ncbi:TIGR03619 family F420-dependent LLM class oxidoreductase [Streptomyces kanamyceticus]|uniref:TIGR03619 family F420-dependent LLM class oxidoreductase n=1 Tax=Streptomyces kanamyceticus TaxID=1967 RepID=A0A5J6GFI8_STRKN|nr:TIGR03619 family F420-dependent LLM class oxidoreductase [Streptomyces kanamyceticus]QEU93707.1 TIGR03619 family F420-dependent LLM class oxidoreductase [Streptomyces kanamyceticus]
MRISATLYMTDGTISPVRLAGELEGRGFGGLYLPEHTHIPLSRETPYPGGELPPECARMLSPFVALAQAAAVTQRITLGTNIALVAQHDPIDLAKQIATLDHLSGGRVTLGVGYGWNREEAADHGVEWTRRRAVVRDGMAVMRALWSDQPTAYEGEFASVRASEVHPKPLLAPRKRLGKGPLFGPRTLIGGAAGPGLFAHIAEYADGWMPIGGSGLREALPVLRQVWADAGREPDDLYVAVTAVQPEAGKLAHYAELGIDEAVVQLPPAGAAEVCAALDAHQRHLR